MTVMHPTDPRLVVFAEAVQHRWAWPGATEVVIDGQVVNASTVVIETLRVLDGIIHFIDGSPAGQMSVEDAARLLARYSDRYDDPPHGYGWQAVLRTPEHAYTAAQAAARSQKVRDQIDAAYAVLCEEVARRAPDGAA